MTVSLGYRLWHNDTDTPEHKSKAVLVKEMVEAVLPVLAEKRIIILFDSWYPRAPLPDLYDPGHVDIICAAKKNTAMYGLPEKRAGRGRPSKRGAKIENGLASFSLKENRTLECKIGVQQVLTDLFETDKEVPEGRERANPKPVPMTAVVTQKDRGARRLFLSTITGAELNTLFAGVDMNWDVPDDMLPYAIYRYRWPIGTQFYVQKSFFGLNDYILRSEHGMMMYVNLVCITASTTVLLPRLCPEFASFQNMSAYDVLVEIGKLIQYQINLSRFAAQIPRTSKFDLCRKIIMRTAASLTAAA